MNYATTSKSNFENRLAYFGGAINATTTDVSNEFQDLEAFFIDATLVMGNDVRVTQAFLNWLIRYGSVLCPSKIKKLLGTMNFDPAILGALIAYLKEYDHRPSRWKLLDQFTKKTNKLLFADLPVPRNKNPYFAKYGITAPLLLPNEEKYLLPKEAVLKKCPELRYRSMMMGTVSSDLHSLIEKKGASMSAYEMAKITHHHKAQVYSLIDTMKRVGSLVLNEI
jgi:hypothetical protein